MLINIRKSDKTMRGIINGGYQDYTHKGELTEFFNRMVQLRVNDEHLIVERCSNKK